MGYKSKFIIGIILSSFCLSSVSFAESYNQAGNDQNINTDVSKLNQVNSNELNTDTSKLNQANNILNTNNSNENEQNLKRIDDEKKYDFSPVEEIFNSKTDTKKDKPLLQFGYEFFENAPLTTENNTIQKNYKLNIGDRVNVYFWGDSIDLVAITGNDFIKSVNDIAVDKDGNIFIPGVGVVQAKGKTTENIEAQIYSALSGKFKNFKVKVSINTPGCFPISVMGNVKNPGTVYINESSNLLDILKLAGGISKNGSLREIILIDSSTHKRTSLDLYKILINGNYQPVKFRESDIILVKPIGKIIALDNGVKRPAIYEFKDKETLNDIIGFAGGFLPYINSSNVQVQSFDPKKGEKVARDISFDKLSKLYPQDGDLISFKNIYGIAENLVNLEGNIKHPGSYQYKKGMRLSDIIKSQDELLSKTYTAQAVISRVSGTGKEIVSIPVSLNSFFRGEIDPELMPQDKITIYSSTATKSIEVAGYIRNPGIIPYREGMTLKDVLGSVEFGDTSNTDDNFSKYNSSDLVVEVSNEDNTEPDIKTVYLYDLLTRNQRDLDIAINPKDKIFIRPVKENESLKTVKVFGYVRNPGVYKFYSGMKLSDAIQSAGGLNSDGYLKGLVLSRPSIYEIQKNAMQDSKLKLQEDILQQANTYQALEDNNKNAEQFLNNQKALIDTLNEKESRSMGRISINISSNNLKSLKENENIELRDGDEIYIPYLSKHVIVMGDVLNQSAIVYNQNKSVKYYIDKVGGLSEHANKGKIYIVHSNGTAQKVGRFSSVSVDPGDVIIIPSKMSMPVNWMDVARNFAQITSSALNTIFILTKI